MVWFGSLWSSAGVSEDTRRGLAVYRFPQARKGIVTSIRDLPTPTATTESRKFDLCVHNGPFERTGLDSRHASPHYILAQSVAVSHGSSLDVL